MYRSEAFNAAENDRPSMALSRAVRTGTQIGPAKGDFWRGYLQRLAAVYPVAAIFQEEPPEIDAERVCTRAQSPSVPQKT